MKYTITKKFTDSIRMSDGTLKSFTTGLETEVDVDSGDALVAEADKIFAQVVWLVQRDQEKVFGTGA